MRSPARAATLVAVLLLLAAGARAQGPPTRPGALPRPDDFPDVLSAFAEPRTIDAWPAARFSDLGAWFAYTLSPPGADGPQAGFAGPFLVNEGAWAAHTLARLEIEDDAGHVVPLEGAEAFETHVFPGRLHRRVRAGGFTATLDLVFVSGRSAVVRATVANDGAQGRRVGIGWRGEGLEGGGRFTAATGEIHLETPRGGRVRVVPLDASQGRPVVPFDGRSFSVRPSGLTFLGPGQSATRYLAHLVSAAGETDERERGAIEILARAPVRAFLANDARWRGYLAPALRFDPAFAAVPGYRVAAVKALMTLVGNWRRPIGTLRHAGLARSSAPDGAAVFAASEAWKQAVALARFAPDLAEEQLRAAFDQQDGDGMVAEVFSTDGRRDDRRHAGPPMAAWAVLEVYRNGRDRSFLHELHPRLLRYLEWWQRRRDRDQDGLCEYGASVEDLAAARAESGMAEGARFDGARLSRLADGAWTLNLESVDLSAYLYVETRVLGEMTRELLREDPALVDRAARLGAAARGWLFDPSTGFFYDRASDGGPRVYGQAAEGWIPLWAGVASPAQAAGVRAALVDPRKFATSLPFPTLAADDPRFDPASLGRGAVSLDLAGFALEGLRRYGFGDDATRLARQVLDRARGLTDAGVPIREAYHPLTGEGLGAPDASAAAAHLLLLLWGDGAAPSATSH